MTSVTARHIPTIDSRILRIHALKYFQSGIHILCIHDDVGLAIFSYQYINHIKVHIAELPGQQSRRI